jgi:para-nitrobenzyl esterase
MRRRRLVVAAALSLIVALVAAGCDPLVDPPGAAPVRYRDDMFSVTRTTGIVYGSAVNQDGATVTLALDMYQPTGDAVPARPAIVWVHGGSFAFGSRTSPELVDEANYFARKGYVNVSIDYRLDSVGCTNGGSDVGRCVTAIQQAQQDAQTAVRFLREQATTFRIDTTRIAIGGSSAGAITALNVGYSPENPGPGAHQGFSSAVRAVQSLSGAQLASSAIDAGDAAALLFHGTNDPLVPYAWATGTVDRATQAGLEAILITYTDPQNQAHVPYSLHRDDILTKTRNFFWWDMDAGNAAR